MDNKQTKTCSNCKVEKNISEFNFRYINKKGNPVYRKNCKECEYRLGKQKYWGTEKYRQKSKIRIKEGYDFIYSLKLTAICKDCNIQFDVRAMDFDHIGKKTRDMCRMLSCTKNRILEEVSQCEIVCANCHANRTYNRIGPRKPARNCVIRNRKIISDGKRKPCEICHIQYEPWQMEYDHINPSQKSYTIALMKSYSKEKLESEISKCRVLCRNCHRIHTIKERTLHV